MPMNSGATQISVALKAKEQKRLKKKLSWLRRPHVLLLDEVGYEPLSPERAHVFFQLINARYETGSAVMTSNKPSQNGQSDEAVATAMLGRLLHQAFVNSMKGVGTRSTTPCAEVFSRHLATKPPITGMCRKFVIPYGLSRLHRSNSKRSATAVLSAAPETKVAFPGEDHAEG